jgi:CRP-like cAMP-binding protein
MATRTSGSFDSKAFLVSVGEARSISKFREGEVIFAQGDPAYLLFYIRKGMLALVGCEGEESVPDGVPGANPNGSSRSYWEVDQGT